MINTHILMTINMRFTEVKDIKLIVTLKIFDFSLSGKNVLSSVYSIFA